jgi:acetamidase/formamidase
MRNVGSWHNSDLSQCGGMSAAGESGLTTEPGVRPVLKINKIVPRAYAMNFNVPGMFGQFPDRFPEGQVKYFYLDLERKVAEFAPGIEIPLRPFPGTTAVARAEPGQYSTVPPGRYAGNIDVRDFTEGAALYIPIFVKGALLWTGDSHAHKVTVRSI